MHERAWLRGTDVALYESMLRELGTELDRAGEQYSIPGISYVRASRKVFWIPCRISVIVHFRWSLIIVYVTTNFPVQRTTKQTSRILDVEPIWIQRTRREEICLMLPLQLSSSCSE